MDINNYSYTGPDFYNTGRNDTVAEYRTDDIDVYVLTTVGGYTVICDSYSYDNDALETVADFHDINAALALYNRIVKAAA